MCESVLSVFCFYVRSDTNHVIDRFVYLLNTTLVLRITAHEALAHVHHSCPAPL